MRRYDGDVTALRRPYHSPYTPLHGSLFDLPLLRTFCPRVPLSFSPLLPDRPALLAFVVVLVLLLVLVCRQVEVNRSSDGQQVRYHTDLSAFRTFTYKNTKFEDKNWVSACLRANKVGRWEPHVDR
jgi:hypothetical protein